MSRTVTRALLALSLLAAVGLASCSNGGGSSRPTASEIATVLTAGPDATMDREMAECYGRILTESDLSDATLRALVEGQEDYDPEDIESESAALVDAFTRAASECGSPS